MRTYADAWLMQSRHVKTLEAQVSSAQAHMQEFQASELAVHEVGESPAFAGVQMDGTTATVRMHGVMLDSVPAYYAFFGIEAVDMGEVGQVLLALDADDSIELVILDIDSPGGTVSGTEQLANIVNGMRTPTEAVVSDLIASAAYWVGAAAGTIRVTTKTAAIGSIGVYNVLFDTSEMFSKMGVKAIDIKSSELKGGAIDGVPISDAIIADSKRIIVQLFDQFKSAVAAFRDMTTEQVEAVATGQVFLANEALELGLIDFITAGNVSAQAKEEFAMDANDAIALAVEFPDFAAELKAHVANGSDESEIRADLGYKSLEAKVTSESARADSAEAKLSEVQEKADSVEAKDAEITELKAKVDAFEKFPEQPTDAGPGAQSVATIASEEGKPETIEVPEGYEAKIADDGSQYLEMKEGAE